MMATMNERSPGQSAEPATGLPIELGAPPASILLVRPSALGDVCRTVPVLVSLRRAFPGARIDWLVQDTFADAVRAHPALTGVVEFPRRRFGNVTSVRVLREIWAWLGRLRETRYDWAIDAQGLARSGLFTRWSGARVRIGPRSAPEFAWLGYNRPIDVDPAMHAVDRMLALVRGVGLPAVPDMRLYPPPGARAELDADERLGGAFAVLAPTSRWPGKRWPQDRFAGLARALLDRGAVERVAVVGSASERDQCGPLLRALAGDKRVVDLIGRTSVGSLMALIERSALIVANDSAVLHMAVGLARPMVALYGPTVVARVGPYRAEATVVQHARPGERLDHKDERLGAELMGRIGLDEVIERSLIALRSSAQP